MIEDKILLRLSVVIRDNAAAVDTDARLICLVMPVSAADGVVNSIDIECPFHRKRDILFDHRQVSPLVGMCRQLNKMCHSGIIAPAESQPLHSLLKFCD